FLSVIHGFWDGFYSTLWADGNVGSITDLANLPPWNYAPMLASVWIAILPSALILAGFARALAAGSARRDALPLAAVALATQLAARVVVLAQVPIYSQVKATYTLALTPVFGLLAASGVEWLSRSGIARVAAIAGLGAWGALVLCSYFVV